MAAERNEVSSGADRTPEQIERDIARTRAELSETIDSIQERFSPAYVRRQVTREAKHTAREVGNNMMETVRENPLPAAIAALSIGWLFMKSNRGSSSSENYTRYRSNYYPYERYQGYYDRPEQGYYGGSGYYGTEDSSSSMKDRVRDTTDTVREKAGEVRERVGEISHDVRDRAASMSDEARYRAEQLAHSARRRADDTSYRLERFVNENPLMAGAIVMAAGAAIGMALPSTEIENEYFGETRDNLMNQASEQARRTMQRVERVASNTMEEVRTTVKTEAQKEGLTSGS